MQNCFDFITDDLIQASIGLSGGGGSSVVGSCGTFSAGLMVLSLRLCPSVDTAFTEADKKAFKHAKAIFAEFREWFIEEFGGVNCRDVQFNFLGRVYNLMDEDQQKAFRTYQEQSGSNCRQICQMVAIKVAEMLLADSPEK